MDAFAGEFYQIFLENIIPRCCGCKKLGVTPIFPSETDFSDISRVKNVGREQWRQNNSLEKS